MRRSPEMDCSRRSIGLHQQHDRTDTAKKSPRASRALAALLGEVTVHADHADEGIVVRDLQDFAAHGDICISNCSAAVARAVYLD